MPNSVTPIMPLNTAVPSERRISAPAPVARTSGTTPRMKAKEVIVMGRRRNRDASTAASARDLPPRCNCWANSAGRLVFAGRVLERQVAVQGVARLEALGGRVGIDAADDVQER